MKKKILRFQEYCTCGGYAWSMNGRHPSQPHMAYCPQRHEWAEWWDSLADEEKKPHLDTWSKTH